MSQDKKGILKEGEVIFEIGHSEATSRLKSFKKGDDLSLIVQFPTPDPTVKGRVEIFIKDVKQGRVGLDKENPFTGPLLFLQKMPGVLGLFISARIVASSILNSKTWYIIAVNKKNQQFCLLNIEGLCCTYAVTS
jgi:hypothetical protein